MVKMDLQKYDVLVKEDDVPFDWLSFFLNLIVIISSFLF